LARLAKLPPSTSRPLGLVDALILVASIAPGLLLVRFANPTIDWDYYLHRVWFSPAEQGYTWLAKLDAARELMVVLVPCWVSVTLAVLGLHFRRPRPPWRRLTRSPGFVACVAVALVVMVVGARVLLSLLRGRLTPPGQALPPELDRLPALGGLAVLASWTSLALAGRWRADRGGLDRLGRLVGAAWVAGLAVNFIIESFR